MRHNGFTLIELMIAVAILGILSAIAVPSYAHFMVKSNRSDAKIVLTSTAQRIQRCYTALGTYKPEKDQCKVIDQLNDSGLSSEHGWYKVQLEKDSYTQHAFVLKAIPVADSRQQNDTQCAAFTLDNIGRKKATDTSAADTSELCW